MRSENRLKVTGEPAGGWSLVIDVPRKQGPSEHRLDESRHGADVRLRLQCTCFYSVPDQEPQPATGPARLRPYAGIQVGVGQILKQVREVSRDGSRRITHFCIADCIRADRS
jgi:hypothetical protein